MINLILFGSFFVMLLLNIPIAAQPGYVFHFRPALQQFPLTVVPTNVYSGMAKFLLLAIPFFVLSGNIMAKAGISSRLVAFADDCVGHRRGGIAIWLLSWPASSAPSPAPVPPPWRLWALS